MFEDYEDKSFSNLDAWKKKVELICNHRKYNLDYEVVSNTYDLDKLYSKGLSPRNAVETIVVDIFGENF